jgi:hypothetical protein
MTEINQLITFMKSKENKYYHKPEYTKCKWHDNDCECREPIIIKHPLVDMSSSVPNYYRIVSASVIHNGNSLSHASTELQDNEVFVIAVVQQSSGALKICIIKTKKFI